MKSNNGPREENSAGSFVFRLVCLCFISRRLCSKEIFKKVGILELFVAKIIMAT